VIEYKRKKYGRRVANVGETKNVSLYKIVVRKPKTKKPFGRPRHRWGQYYNVS
jgi:hypothetical protein